MSDETITGEFVLFWGGVFSQWYESPFKSGRDKYPTAEHWMMVHKALLFSDHDAVDEILATDSPKEAKAIGRRVKNFDPEVWADDCFEIVVDGNRLKFTQNKEARLYLLNTGNKILVEASPYDKIWGIGMGQDEVEADNPALWKGTNLLGLALMVVRSELK